MCHYQIHVAHCQLGEAVSAVMKLGTSETFWPKNQPAASERCPPPPSSFLPRPPFPAFPSLARPPRPLKYASNRLGRPPRARFPRFARFGRADRRPRARAHGRGRGPHGRTRNRNHAPKVLHSLESNSAPVVANLHISHMHIRRRAAPPRRRSGHARKSAPRIRRLIRRQPYPAAARWWGAGVDKCR